MMQMLRTVRKEILLISLVLQNVRFREPEQKK